LGVMIPARLQLCIFRMSITRISPTSRQPNCSIQLRRRIDDRKGVQTASQRGASEWGTCLSCAILMKSGDILPTVCRQCFSKYCYGGGEISSCNRNTLLFFMKLNCLNCAQPCFNPRTNKKVPTPASWRSPRSRRSFRVGSIIEERNRTQNRKA
jgi:hypothetical protein